MRKLMHYKYPKAFGSSRVNWFAEGDGGGDKGKGGGEDTVSKAEYDKVLGEVAKTKQDLEDMRLEVLSPDYLDYLNSKGEDKGKDKGEDKVKDDLGLDDEKLEKLSKKEILELATRNAEKSLQTRLDKIEQFSKSEREAERKAEVAAFARKHDDYDTYRPVMYGLSLDPKNAGLTLQELYDKSKDHIKGIHTETSEAEKERQRKISNEKPGGFSEGLEKHKDLSAEAAAEEASKLVEEKLGPIPSA